MSGGIDANYDALAPRREGIMLGGTERMQAYCVKCREKRDLVDGEEVVMKNGKKAMQGKCPECGTKLFRIMGKA